MTIISRPLLLFSSIILLLIFAFPVFDRHPENAASLSTAVASDMSHPQNGSLRLVIVSDTHQVYQQALPKGDVLIHCGDSELSPQALSTWASSHAFNHTLAISGNMDSFSKTSHFTSGVTYLQDSSTTIAGLTFYGSPWTPKFVGAFQLGSDREARQVWQKLPINLDVLITHGPPAGILDRTSRGMPVGDSALMQAVNAIHPRVHCFGHVHESYGTTHSKQTLFCNAAVFNGHRPIVVDVPLDRSKPAVLVKDI